MGEADTGHKDSRDTVHCPERAHLGNLAAPGGLAGWRRMEGTYVHRLLSGNTTETLMPIKTIGEESQKQPFGEQELRHAHG